MVADAVLRNALERVVERVDPQRRPAPIVVDGAAEREDRVVLVHEHGVVDLEQEARVDDTPVLLVQRVRDREHELFFGRVVLVPQPVHARGRDHRQERVGDVHALERATEAGDVPLDRSGVVRDRPGAEPELAAGLLPVVGAATVLGHVHAVLRRPRERRVVLRVELGERLPVAARREHRALADRDEALLDPPHAAVEVRDPGRLPHLAVVHDVDAGRCLAADHVADGLAEDPLIGVFVDRLAALLSGEDVEQLVGTDEASGVRGEDAIHRSSGLFAGEQSGVLPEVARDEQVVVRAQLLRGTVEHQLAV